MIPSEDRRKQERRGIWGCHRHGKPECGICIVETYHGISRASEERPDRRRSSGDTPASGTERCPTCGSPDRSRCVGHCPDHWHDGHEPLEMGVLAHPFESVPPDTPVAPPSQEGIPACEVIEPFDVAPPQTLLEWMRERHANCLRLASQKSGEDKLGWLEDAEYFRQAIERLADSSFISDSPRNSAASTKLFLKLVAVAHSLGISTWEAQERLSIDALREAARASAPLPAERPQDNAETEKE